MWKQDIPHLIPDLEKITHGQHKYLKSLKIMTATPTRGGTVMGNYELAMISLSKWAERLDVHLDVQRLMGCSYIEQGRNVLANTFWNSDCTHLVFIDADNGFITNNFFELLLTKKDIVGGCYTKRKINWEAVHRAVLAGVPPEMLAHCSGEFPMHALPGEGIQIGHEPQKVLTLPTGFMSISRKALETYVKAFPDRKTTPGNPGHYGIQFFDAGTKTHRDEKGEMTRGFDSEDNTFCKEMLTLGINSWLCPWMTISHYGEHLFEACFPCSNGAFVHLPGWIEAQKK